MAVPMSSEQRAVRIAHLEEQQKSLEFEVRDSEWTMEEVRKAIQKAKEGGAASRKKLREVTKELRRLIREA